MSERALTLLQLCALPVNSAERDTRWADLAAVTPLVKLQAMLRDYTGESGLKRRFLTSKEYAIAELTPHGRERLKRGLDLRADRGDGDACRE